MPATPVFFQATLVAFIFYILVVGHEVLEAQRAFTAFLIFHIIQMRLVNIPQALSYAIQGIIVLRKVRKFFEAEELTKDAIERPSMNLSKFQRMHTFPPFFR